MGRKGLVIVFAGLFCFAASFFFTVWLTNRTSFFGQNAHQVGDNLLEPEIAEADQLEVEESNIQEYYIGIYGSNVAIFQGRPGKGGILIETTNIPLDKIPEFEIRNLHAGIPFSDQEEKYRILEGLHFPL